MAPSARVDWIVIGFIASLIATLVLTAMIFG